MIQTQGILKLTYLTDSDSDSLLSVFFFRLHQIENHQICKNIYLCLRRLIFYFFSRNFYKMMISLFYKRSRNFRSIIRKKYSQNRDFMFFFLICSSYIFCGYKASNMIVNGLHFYKNTPGAPLDHIRKKYSSSVCGLKNTKKTAAYLFGYLLNNVFMKQNTILLD